MPFNEFERRAEELFRGDSTPWSFDEDIQARLLIKDLLFEIRRLRDKLGGIRKILSTEDY